jgi:hypothetical protein
MNRQNNRNIIAVDEVCFESIRDYLFEVVLSDLGYGSASREKIEKFLINTGFKRRLLKNLAKRGVIEIS